MNGADKQLLLKDLSARLPDGVRYKGDGGWGINPYQHSSSLNDILCSEKPLVYLRPMSSMTEEEKKEYDILTPIVEVVFPCDAYPLIDWLNKKMFDYRGLIPMGLALEAPENMYNTKTE